MTELSVGGTGIGGNLSTLLKKLTCLKVLNVFGLDVTGCYKVLWIETDPIRLLYALYIYSPAPPQELEMIPSLHKIVLTGCCKLNGSAPGLQEALPGCSVEV